MQTMPDSHAAPYTATYGDADEDFCATDEDAYPHADADTYCQPYSYSHFYSYAKPDANAAGHNHPYHPGSAS